MKNFKKVTILGHLMVAALVLVQCGPGWKNVEQEGGKGLEAGKGPSADANLQKGIECYEQGDLECANGLIEEVLSREPAHPDALRYREWMRKRQFCTVYTGDTLSDIAGYYYDDPEKWTVIAKANRIEDPKGLRTHARLVIPFFPVCEEGRSEVGRLQNRFFRGKDPAKIVVYPVKERDSLGSIAKKYYGSARLSCFLADYNNLEKPEHLMAGMSLRIPVFPERQRAKQDLDRTSLRRARNAMEAKDYVKAHSDLVKISKRSSSWPDAERLLGECRSEGSAHYALLGDRWFEQADPQRACHYWEQALILNPEDGEVQRKLEEARELIRTLQMLNRDP